MIDPVFIPTKGRHGKQPASHLLQDAGIAHMLVVEPQDADAYRAAGYDNLLVLPENDRGIAFARNFIKRYATTPYWMLDDDIGAFYLVENNRCVKAPASDVLEKAQSYIREYDNVGQGALEYQQFAWSARKPYTLNSYCDVCVWIDPAKTKLCNYRSRFILKEDRDFTLQVLSSGRLTLRVQDCAFAAPANGSNAGGLYDVYATLGCERDAVDALCALWPGIVSAQTKPNGRYDARINWRAFSVK